MAKRTRKKRKTARAAKPSEKSTEATSVSEEQPSEEQAKTKSASKSKAKTKARPKAASKKASVKAKIESTPVLDEETKESAQQPESVEGRAETTPQEPTEASAGQEDLPAKGDAQVQAESGADEPVADSDGSNEKNKNAQTTQEEVSSQDTRDDADLAAVDSTAENSAAEDSTSEAVEEKPAVAPEDDTEGDENAVEQTGAASQVDTPSEESVAADAKEKQEPQASEAAENTTQKVEEDTEHSSDAGASDDLAAPDASTEDEKDTTQNNASASGTDPSDAEASKAEAEGVDTDDVEAGVDTKDTATNDAKAGATASSDDESSGAEVPAESAPVTTSDVEKDEPVKKNHDLDEAGADADNTNAASESMETETETGAIVAPEEASPQEASVHIQPTQQNNEAEEQSKPSLQGSDEQDTTTKEPTVSEENKENSSSEETAKTPATAATAPKREAMVFIAGSMPANELNDESLGGFANRMISALKRNAGSKDVEFALKEQEFEERYSKGMRTEVRTIQRLKGDREDDVLDLYSFNYRKPLVGDYEKRTLLTQGLSVLWALIVSLPLAIRAMFRSSEGKSMRQKLQAFLAFGFTGGLGFYVLFLAYSLFLTLPLNNTKTLERNTTLVSVNAQAASSAVVKNGTVKLNKASVTTKKAGAKDKKPKKAAKAKPETRPVVVLQQSAPADNIPWIPTFFLWLTALGLLKPSWRQMLTDTATRYVCLVYYLSQGRRRDVLAGELTELLEHIARKEEFDYSQVHLVTYSFGSIVALDTLFPFDQVPQDRFKIPHNLVTIAPSFDLIRSVWPNYFKGRQNTPYNFKRWININNNLDVLGSNFRDDDESGEAVHGMVYFDEESSVGKSTKLPEVIAFRNGPAPEYGPLGGLVQGIMLHTRYWADEYEANSCFHPMVKELYQDHEWLR